MTLGWRTSACKKFEQFRQDLVGTFLREQVSAFERFAGQRPSRFLTPFRQNVP
jgi:hypothetical protein